MPFNVCKDVLFLPQRPHFAEARAPVGNAVKRALHVQFAVEMRQFPQPREQTRFRSLLHGNAVAALQNEHCVFLDPACFFRFAHGEFRLGAGAVRFACLPQRAAFAVRCAVRDADGRAELHERLRECAAVAALPIDLAELLTDINRNENTIGIF